MKNAIYILLFLCFSIANAQVPNMFSYRSVVTNSDNMPIQNEEVIVQIKIQDSETESAKTFYYEIHNLTTNKNGAFSLQIGKGKPQGDFKNLDDVDWAEGDRFINVIVLNSKNEMVSKGTTQLMSVPYALLAREVIDADTSNGTLDCFDNIAALRAYTTLPNDGDMACIAGHTSDRDGGEGTFHYVESFDFDDDNGIIIKPNDDLVPPEKDGRWIRHIDGYININYYGVTGGNQTTVNGVDIEDVIQKAIDYASENTRFDHYQPANPFPTSEFTKGNTIFFPNGEYHLNKSIIIKDGVHILGEENTQFAAVSSYDYLLKIGIGPVNTSIENITLNCNTNSGGILSKAQIDSDNQGGLWRGNFKNINIVNVGNNDIGIFLEGGLNNSPKNQNPFKEPNQFNVFQNVNIKRISNDAFCLKSSGQLGQHTFINCAFDGQNIHQLGQNVQLNGGAVISFLNCSFQSAEYGILMNGSQSVTIDNCWFENLKMAVSAHNQSKSITVRNSRFANACGYGSLEPTAGGRCITCKDSSINVENNYVLVTPEGSNGGTTVSASDVLDAYTAKFILGVDNNNIINAKNNQFQNIGLSKTYGIHQSVQVTNNTLDSSGKKLVFAGISGITNLNRIDSSINAGETIFIRANGTGTLNLNHMSNISGRNIFIPSGQTVTLNNGQSAIFMKIDNIVGNEPATYQLISAF